MEAREIVRVLKGDKEALKELAEELVQTPDVRLALINAVLRDVATKGDIEKLRQSTAEDFEKLRREFKEELTATEHRIKEEIKSYVEVKFDALNRRVDDLYKVTVSALFGILLTLATLIITRVF